MFSLETEKKWVFAHRKKLILLFLIYIVYRMMFYVNIFLSFRKRTGKDPCQVASDSLRELKFGSLKRTHIPETWKPKLPKIIHQQWITSNITNPLHLKFHKKFKELFPEPEYQHILWTDETQLQLIKANYSFFLDTYLNYRHGIQRADSSRYFILHQYGGLYVDLDYEPLVNFWEYLPQDRPGIIESPYKYAETVQNSLMSSPAFDPFWLNVFALLIQNRYKHVDTSTGPLLLDNFLNFTDSSAYILPCENFHRIPFFELNITPPKVAIDREILARDYPMKYCGDFRSNSCHFGKHHSTAVYYYEVRDSES